MIFVCFPSKTTKPRALCLRLKLPQVASAPISLILCRVHSRANTLFSIPSIVLSTLHVFHIDKRNLSIQTYKYTLSNRNLIRKVVVTFGFLIKHVPFLA